MADGDPDVIPRSYLYVPGDRPDRFAKAAASGADAVVLDLEDAVGAAAKDDARAAVVDWLTSGAAPGVQWWVRINVDSRGDDDIAALAPHARGAGVFVPKATPDGLGRLAAAGLRMCALVETATAVLTAAEIARTKGVVAMAMGEIDLVAELGVEAHADAAALWPARAQVVLASAAAGLPAPIGPVAVDFTDLEELRRTTLDLRRAGFHSRQAIHPAQVPVLNEVLTPSADELARAERVLELFERAAGGVCVDEDGRMVDEAVVRAARRVVARRTRS